MIFIGFFCLPSTWAISHKAAPTLRLPDEFPLLGYALTNAFGDLRFDQPVCIVSAPGETNRIFIVERRGRIFALTNLTAPTKTLFLDLSPSTFSASGECGLLGLAFHPGYATNGFFYVYRTSNRTGPDGVYGLYDQLSRFQVSPEDPDQGMFASEMQILMQLDWSDVHNAGDLKFGPDGYLYLALGSMDDAHASALGDLQPIEHGFFGAILRIDVDRRPGSLPPNPHPGASTNYAIPPDNPFVAIERYHGRELDPTKIRTSFYAVGLRNPWRFAFDSLTGDLYCGDVGGGSQEEINLIKSGGNYGWPYLEANEPTKWVHPYPEEFKPEPPLYSYAHGYATNQGRVVIGGVVCRGAPYPDLEGAYLFGDNVPGHIWALRHDGTNVTWFRRVTGFPGLTSFGIDPHNQEVLVANLQGQINRLVHLPEEAEQFFPKTLDQTGAFVDLISLQPEEGIVPYDINVSFWSDNAIKQRWFAIPKPQDQIQVGPSNAWTFPKSTTWIKHFELELTNGVASSRRRLETRFLVKSATGIYGVTYRWDDTQTNAFLVPDEGAHEVLQINEDGLMREQIWRYPGRSECNLCHAGRPLGFNTEQLNQPIFGPGTTNQLVALSNLGYFKTNYATTAGMIQMVPAHDTSAPLQHRARSYFGANCSQCHYPASWTGTQWDARFTTRTADAGIMNAKNWDQSTFLIKSGNLLESMVHYRLSTSYNLHRMPPIGSNLINSNGLDLISQWILGYPPEPWRSEDVGQTPREGSSTIFDDRFQINGAGRGLTNTSDACHFLHQAFTGNGQITAHLLSPQSAGSEAGLMIRSSIAADAIFAALLRTTDGVVWRYRLTEGAEAISEPIATTNDWLHLVRHDTSIIAFASPDGVNWEQTGSAILPLNQQAIMGLTSNSGDESVWNQAHFDSVSTLTPAISLGQPTNSYRASADVQLRASFVQSGVGLSKVEFFVGTEKVGEVFEPPFDVVWTNAWAGSHNVYARVTDNSGATVDSTPILVTIEPALSLGEFSAESHLLSGSWKGAYGAEGVLVVNDATNFPSRVVFSMNEVDLLVWEEDSLRSSALMRVYSSNRTSAAWSGEMLDLNLLFQDGEWHRLSMYFVDPSATHDDEAVIDLLDAENGDVLDSRRITFGSKGRYITWTVQGHVRLQIRSLTSPNALLSGLFLDPVAHPPLTVVLAATATASTPPGTTTITGHTAIEEAPVSLALVHFYTGDTLLATDTNAPFELLWTDVPPGFHILKAQAEDETGYLWESNPVELEVWAPNSARFLGHDTMTQGNWKEFYGRDGYLIAGHATNLSPAVRFETSTTELLVDEDYTSEVAGLQHVDGGGRIISFLADSPSLDFDLTLDPNASRTLAMYFARPADADAEARLSVSLFDGTSGEWLDERTVNLLTQPTYLLWNVRGHISVQIHAASPTLPLGILNGFFVDSRPTALEWFRSFFTAEELSEPRISGDGADPDLDGQPNLLEYLYGTDPNLASAGPIIQASMGAGEILISFPRSKQAWDVITQLEVSNDLKNWTPAGDSVEEVDVLDYGEMEQVILRSVPPADAVSRFFRLTIERRVVDRS